MLGSPCTCPCTSEEGASTDNEALLPVTIGSSINVAIVDLFVTILNIFVINLSIYP
jgi:hypothetical protein